MDPMRAYLLGGMLVHKLVWELLKRGQPVPRAPLSPVKLLKMGVLAGLLAQTLLPDVFPITGEPALLRIVGTGVFTAGLGIAVAGRLQLGRNWSNIEDAAVLPSQRVVDRGVYAWVRHPIYVGDLLLVAGLELALNSWLILGVPALFLATRARVLREENMLCAALAGYADYCARTGRFLPKASGRRVANKSG